MLDCHRRDLASPVIFFEHEAVWFFLGGCKPIMSTEVGGNTVAM